MSLRFQIGVWALLLSAAAAQGNAPAVTIETGVPSTYRVGPGDVINIRVLDDDALNETVAVDAEGKVPLPESRTPVAVAGLTVLDIDRAVESALVKDELSVNGVRVDASVASVQSKPVQVNGAVRNGGTWQATQPLGLLKVLNLAGGATDAAAQVQVFKADAAGNATMIYQSSFDDLVRTSGLKAPMLTGGETIDVLPGGKIYVIGAVAHSAAIPMDSSDPITVLKALALAGQSTRVAQLDKAVIMHSDGTVQPVNVKAILNHKQPDPVMQANDILQIPSSTGKATGYGALTATVQIITIAMGALLIAH